MDQFKLYTGVNFTTKDTIKFTSLEAQKSFFNGRIRHIVDGREAVVPTSIKVPNFNYYELLDVTYVSTEKIVSGKTKTFYYFVTDIEYRNDNLSLLHLELDVLQTYMFDYEIKNSNIIREHQNRFDSEGNRVFSKTKEPITVNNFEYIEEEIFAEGLEESGDVFYILRTRKPEGSIGDASLTKYGNLHSYLEYSVSAFTFNDTTKTMGRVYYEQLVSGGEPIEIKMANLEVMSKVSYKPELVDISIVPHLPGFEVYKKNGKTYIKNDAIPAGANNSVVSWTSFAEDTAGGGGVINIKDLNIPNGTFKPKNPGELNNWFIRAVGTLNNNTHKEGKIFSPQFMEATIVEGVNNTVNFYLDELKKESFVNSIFTLPYLFGNSVSKVFSLGVKDYAIPNNILVSNVTDSLILITDEYLNSLKFEANNRSAAKLNGVINAVAGLGISAVSGGALAPLALGQMTGLATHGINERAKLDDLRSRPIKLGTETDNVDFNLTSGFTKPRITLKLPVESEIERITKYFKDYGYAANTFGVPNLTSRKVFNYLEATDMVLTGKIGLETTRELQTIYSQGIRFWHSPNTFLDFNIENDERD